LIYTWNQQSNGEEEPQKVALL